MANPDPYQYEPSANPNMGNNPYADLNSTAPLDPHAPANSSGTFNGAPGSPGYTQPLATPGMQGGPAPLPAAYQPVNPQMYHPSDPRSAINPLTGKPRRPGTVITGLIFTALLTSTMIGIGFFMIIFEYNMNLLLYGGTTGREAYFGSTAVVLATMVLVCAVIAYNGRKWAIFGLLAASAINLITVYIYTRPWTIILAVALALCVVPYFLPKSLAFYRTWAQLPKEEPALPPHLQNRK